MDNQELLDWAVENIEEWKDGWPYLMGDSSVISTFYVKDHAGWAAKKAKWVKIRFHEEYLPTPTKKLFSTAQIVSREEWENAKEKAKKVSETPSRQKFKVGDVVMISPASQYYSHNTDRNPRNTKGVVEHFYGLNRYGVKWSNGMNNGYKQHDLIPYQSPWFGYKYKVTPELSQALQKAVFEDGGKWRSGDETIKLWAEFKYLYVNLHGFVTVDNNSAYFSWHHLPEKKVTLENGKLVEIPADNTELKTEDSSSTLTNQEETQMSTSSRKTVTVNLIDQDPSLDEKHSLVATFGTFTTSKSPEALIRSIIMDSKNKVAELIDQHNQVRITQIDKEILSRTGNKVALEPVEESDLYWEIQ